MDSKIRKARLQDQFEDLRQQERASVLGMWFFLATEVLFFGVLFLGYTVYRTSFPEAFAQGSHHLDITLGTINTAVLLGSSYLVAVAVHFSRRPKGGFRARVLLMLAAGIGCVFLGVKAFEWHHVWSEGLFPGAGFQDMEGGLEGGQLFFAFYYVMTGFHALHVLIGVGLLVGLALLSGSQSWRWRVGNRSVLELAGMYWHFVDIVWLFLFPLLYLIERGSA